MYGNVFAVRKHALSYSQVHGVLLTLRWFRCVSVCGGGRERGSWKERVRMIHKWGK